MTDSATIPASLLPAEQLRRLIGEVESVFHGKHSVVRLALASLLARGHLLFEDVPGVGKTTLSHALARTLGLSFRRIQFTSDLLPSDVVGGAVYDPGTGSLDVRPGPIFSQIILADEINRAPPRTQSGLLQAMQEGRVTLDDRTLELPAPFLVMATQNPLEHQGTYPLPESQLDRFLMRLTIGYPDQEAERRILLKSSRGQPPVESLKPILGAEDVLALQKQVDRVQADESLVDYLMSIVRETRVTPGVRVGVSPRGAIALFRAAKAYALTDGRDYLVPDDIRDLIHPCLAHRILPAGTSPSSTEAHETAHALLDDIVERLEVPV